VVPVSGILFKLAVEPASHSSAIVGEVIVCFVIAWRRCSASSPPTTGSPAFSAVPRMAIAGARSGGCGDRAHGAVTQLLIRPLGLPFEEAEMMMYPASFIGSPIVFPAPPRRH